MAGTFTLDSEKGKDTPEVFLHNLTLVQLSYIKIKTIGVLL